MLLVLIGKDFGHTSDGTAVGQWAGAIKMIRARPIMRCPMPGLDGAPGAERR